MYKPEYTRLDNISIKCIMYDALREKENETPKTSESGDLDQPTRSLVWEQLPAVI